MHFLNKGARAGVGGLVLLAHVLLGWIIVHQARPSDQSSRSIAPLTLIAIAPKAVPRISTDIAADLVEFTGIEMEQPLLSKKEPKEKAETIARSSGNTIAPRLRDSSIDAQPYARRAGLPPGTGATVVLRIEVFASGSVGQVKVDVSGGADSIDAAAIDYVRSLQWIGGRVDDQPATIWIRWGVRLDG